MDILRKGMRSGTTSICLYIFCMSALKTNRNSLQRRIKIFKSNCKIGSENKTLLRLKSLEEGQEALKTTHNFVLLDLKLHAGVSNNWV